MTLYLQHLGIACSLGANATEVAANLFGPNIVLQETDQFSPGRSFLVGKVDAELPEIPINLAHFNCRNNRLLLLALAQIEAAVADAVQQFGRDRVAIVLGTSTSGIAEAEKAFATRLQTGVIPDEFHFMQQQLSGPSDFLSSHLGIHGPSMTISTACSSSANALAAAKNLLLLDQCDAVLVGGADSLCCLTLQGFASLEAMSRGLANPFSKNRDGINVGEGAALMLLSRAPGDIALAGVGCTSDAHHISAPQPDGQGAERAMRSALQQAHIEPASVDYLNLHGTGTPLNDAAESQAVDRLFGGQLPCSSSKPLTGHTLGAAGIIETALCWLSMHDDFNPQGLLIPHHWDGQVDTELAPLALIPVKPVPELVTDQSVPAPLPKVCMSNSFAFGGNNTSVLLARADR
jgi:3-oxoacyl-[acyl-carrier-protein] synthase-1